MRHPGSDRSQQRFEHLAAAAKAAGVKLTHQRLEIFRELAGTEEHPDAETVFRAVQQRVPTVSLDTVYRTLWLLHELGLVSTLGPERDGIRFDANLDPHHHYVCVRCGLVRDFESKVLSSLRLPAAVGLLGSIIDAHVEVRGLCVACEKATASKTQTEAKTQPKVSERRLRLESVSKGAVSARATSTTNAKRKRP